MRKLVRACLIDFRRRPECEVREILHAKVEVIAFIVRVEFDCSLKALNSLHILTRFFIQPG
jgi:hypothetical protein